MKFSRAIDAHRFAFRPDQLGDADRTVAKAAADIEHPVTGAIPATGQQFVAVTGQPRNQEVLEAHELVEEDGIPGFDDDVVPAHAAASSGGLTCRKVQSKSTS